MEEHVLKGSVMPLVRTYVNVYQDGEESTVTLVSWLIFRCDALFKVIGHYWLLLKIIMSIKPYLVMSNGELLIA